MKDLTKGRPLKVIILFSIPILIGTLFNLFYNLADTRIVGTYLGEEALAAIGSISTLSDFITYAVTGFSGGFGIVTAQLYGMRKMENVRRSFYLSLELSAAIAAVLALCCNLFIHKLMDFLNVPAGSIALASSYILIIIGGCIFSMIYNVLVANLRAIGDSVTPLIFLILSALMNVGLDILFVGHTSMGVKGAAGATVLSQAIAAGACFLYMLIRYKELRPQRNDFLPEHSLLLNLLSNGISMALMNCFVALGTLVLQTAINTLGEDIIVAHTAARKISIFFMMPNAVFGACLATYCGQNYGAGRMDRIRNGMRDTYLITCVWACFVILASYTISPYLVYGVTGIHTESIIQTACLYLKVDTLFYFVCHLISVLRSSLQGMGDKLSPVISSSLELIGKALIAALLAPRLGYWGIIITEPIIWVIMIIPLIISTVRILFTGSRPRAAA